MEIVFMLKLCGFRNGVQLISIDEIEASILHFGKDVSTGTAAPNLPFPEDALASIAPDLFLSNYTGPRINMANIEIGVMTFLSRLWLNLCFFSCYSVIS
jgi:hypothetical protein